MSRLYERSDPPEMVLGRVKAFVAHLRDHPGEWYEYMPGVGGHTSQTGTHMKKRYGVEVQRQIIPDSEPARYRIWARWPA